MADWMLWRSASKKQILFEKYKQTTLMTYVRRTRESNKKYLISKERIAPIFIGN
jgi:hypothetical protein